MFNNLKHSMISLFYLSELRIDKNTTPSKIENDQVNFIKKNYKEKGQNGMTSFSLCKHVNGTEIKGK